MSDQTPEAKRRLAVAQQKLRETQCTCLPDPRGHDMFDLECERTKAEIEVDEALTAMGIEI